MSRWHDVLDLPPSATEKQIKRRYKRLAKTLHPDVNRGDPRAEEKFALIREAYERLMGIRTDPESPPPLPPSPNPPPEPDDPLERTKRARSGKQRRKVGLTASMLSAATVAVVGMTLLCRDPAEIDFDPLTRAEVPPKFPIPVLAIAGSEARELFMQALEKYRSGPKVEIESEGFAAWNAEAKAEIEADENAAVAAFARNAFSEALSGLAGTVARAERELAARETAFGEALNAADAARVAANSPLASGLIAKALKWKPTDPEARALARRIENLPALVEALEAAHVVRVENRPEREIEALREVLALDPDHPDAKARAETLARELGGKRYARALHQGFAAADDGKLDIAQTRLAEARAFAPAREETLALDREIAALAHRISVRQTLERADAHSVGDRWKEAAEGYADALKKDPGHGIASQRLDRAREILATREAVEELLAKPERLGGAKAERKITALVDKGVALAAYSPSLARSLKELAQQSERYREEISVRVVSDGRTNIAVRGIGRVGEVDAKDIRLRPGRYTFEGRRKGYHDKLVVVTLTPEDAGRQVEVACDTPLTTR